MQTTYAQKNDNVACTNGIGAASVEDHSEQASSLQRKMDLINSAAQRMTTPVPVQRAENPPPRPNNTGLPDDLKNGVESLSGYSLDNVRVHYNSPKPATVQALAYTQGNDIHVAPGQEHALPHEAWHVTQQMAGRVSPTTNIGGKLVNDNESLEHEADVMGEKAVQCKEIGGGIEKKINQSCCQRALTFKGKYDRIAKTRTEDLEPMMLSDLINMKRSSYNLKTQDIADLDEIYDIVKKNDIDDYIFGENDNSLNHIIANVKAKVSQNSSNTTDETQVESLSVNEIRTYNITFKIVVDAIDTDRLPFYQAALQNGIARSAKNCNGIKYLNSGKTLFEIKIDSDYRLVGKKIGDTVDFKDEMRHQEVKRWINLNSR